MAMRCVRACAPLLLLAARLAVLLSARAARLPPDAAAVIASVEEESAAGSSSSSENIAWPHRNQCEQPDFRKSSLKLIREMPFIGLFEDLKVRGRATVAAMPLLPPPSAAAFSTAATRAVPPIPHPRLCQTATQTTNTTTTTTGPGQV